MSKVGKKPIVIPQGVTVTVGADNLTVKGKEGTIVLPILTYTKLESKDNLLTVTSKGENKQELANWGTMRALAQNAINGVASGFTKELEIQGVGFRASMEGANLVLNLGFTHPIKFETPAGIKISVEKSLVKVFGADRNLVGQTAAKIREFRKPEPYKGKGIRYKGEVVKIKAGKKVAGATGTAA